MTGKYKTELHCHTSEASACASECGADTVKQYIECGYTTLVVTNHFSPYQIGEMPYDRFVKNLFDAAETARKAAGDRLYVLTGMELKLRGSGNEYLVFGVTEEMLMDRTDIFDMSLDEAHRYFNGYGLPLIQAHPMRYGITMVEPELVDGYEVLNAHSAWNSHNDIAHLWAKSVGGEGKILTAGTDHHDHVNTPTAGILTDEPITNSDELIRVLQSGHYDIF